MKEFYRTYAAVDLEAIRHNIREIRNNIKKDTKIMPVIKADAYGHGAIPVAKAIDDLVDVFGVAIAEEAIELRDGGFQKGIVILGYSEPSWFAEILQRDIAVTAFTFEMAQEISRQAVLLGKKARIHIKVDTGMGRIGLTPTRESAQIVGKIYRLPGIMLDGIFTHLARADEKTTEPTKLPLERYERFLEFLAESDIHILNRHVSNSAGIISLPEANFDMIRCGISMYGIYPSGQVSRKPLHLKPAMSWRAAISFVKNVSKGTPISYGGTYVTERETIVATIPVGYADGMKRSLSNKGRVLVNGEYAPILGRICMDQFMIDVTEIQGVSEGTEVTIIGNDGGEEITVEEISALSHSFPYEFLCSIGKRVPRKY